MRQVGVPGTVGPDAAAVRVDRVRADQPQTAEEVW
jgi:hypothetical protein